MHWIKWRSRLKVSPFFSSGGHLVKWSETVRAILIEGYPRNFPVKLIQNLSTDLAGEVVLSLFLFIALRPFCSKESDGLSNVDRGSHKKHIYVIISISIHWFRRRSRLKFFYLLLALAAILLNRAERFEQFW